MHVRQELHLAALGVDHVALGRVGGGLAAEQADQGQREDDVRPAAEEHAVSIHIHDLLHTTERPAGRTSRAFAAIERGYSPTET